MWICLFGPAAGSAWALINPSLQPSDLYQQYGVVLTAKVKEVSPQGDRAVIAVEKVIKGKLEVEQITITTEDEKPAALLSNWQVGDAVVAMVGPQLRGGTDRVIFYFGTRNAWQQAKVRGNDQWLWLPDDLGPESGPGFGLWGTWNGHVDRLIEMVNDLALGHYYHPIKSVAVFDEPVDLASFPQGTLKGVAAHDLDGDGRIDIVATSRDGVKALRQKEDGSFADVTRDWNLHDIKAASVSVASIRGDGRKDLLLDATIYFKQDHGYVPGISVDATLDAQAIHSSGFVDADGDGLPDVLVSLRDGGLRLYRNRGDDVAPRFEDLTRAVGLDSPEAGAGKSGFVAPGDWNNDGRLDLYFAAEVGYLLIQDDRGRFVPAETQVWPSFESSSGPGTTGGATFTTSWRPNRFDLLAATESAFLNLVQMADGRYIDAVISGNELADGVFRLLAPLAEDFNADGTVDIFGITSSIKQANVFLMNRGYGSYMRSEKYQRDLLPKAMGDRGALGAVAVDIDADGDTDLVLASADGVLRLCKNRTWDSRSFEVTPATTQQDRTLANTGIVVVSILGNRGVIGARLELADARGEVHALRWVGAEMTTGCRGSDSYSLAVRQPGNYTLSVRYADGVTTRREVDIKPGKVIKIGIDRPAANAD